MELLLRLLVTGLVRSSLKSHIYVKLFPSYFIVFFGGVLKVFGLVSATLFLIDPF